MDSGARAATKVPWTESIEFSSQFDQRDKGLGSM